MSAKRVDGIEPVGIDSDGTIRPVAEMVVPPTPGPLEQMQARRRFEVRSQRGRIISKSTTVGEAVLHFAQHFQLDAAALAQELAGGTLFVEDLQDGT